ncbi:hypothetical protein LshimejAT787_0600220 [Lyophyllum shimeji]|uniref:Uncharacterized protein n=1 Tax=Lyophyllum shimeji TaxID=47721 RepID=A0A9P3UPC7_LYOSH|nr:hypothetical protein LshimejAT787_0600220 [Lyophyllum shimeji]
MTRLGFSSYGTQRTAKILKAVIAPENHMPSLANPYLTLFPEWHDQDLSNERSLDEAMLCQCAGGLGVDYLPPPPPSSSPLRALVPIQRMTLCNGHAEICSRHSSNVTCIWAHDSPAFVRDP